MAPVHRRALGLIVLTALPGAAMSQTLERPRARELGLEVGVFRPGTHNAITDVQGVRVGHATVVEAPRVNTGVTAILPHGGDLFRERVPAAIHVGNGFGKLLGVTQVRELGELETPILLTCTLCVWKAADALTAWMMERAGMKEVRSINPVVGETNDGFLSDIRSRPLEARHVRQALESAASGPVAEGAVGAGRGTRAFGWKGGIGSSSRVLPGTLGGWTVGVLVQSNFGGILTMNGAPVGRELGRYSFQDAVEGNGEAGGGPGGPRDGQEGGSIMIVVATDAPATPRNLERMAKRAVMGLARTGSYAADGSGDYVIAFSTAPEVRRLREDVGGPRITAELPNEEMNGLFQAAVEATEEAIYNSILKATTVEGHRGTAVALPVDRTLEILRRYNAVTR